MSTPTPKLKKGLILHFKSRNEYEVIIKSSNNRESGMIKTYCATRKVEKEYSVSFIMKWLGDGFVTISEDPASTDTKEKVH